MAFQLPWLHPREPDARWREVWWSPSLRRICRGEQLLGVVLGAARPCEKSWRQAAVNRLWRPAWRRWRQSFSVERLVALGGWTASSTGSSASGAKCVRSSSHLLSKSSATRFWMSLGWLFGCNGDPGIPITQRSAPQNTKLLNKSKEMLKCSKFRG